jgi:putative phosphoribosyl transferase
MFTDRGDAGRRLADRVAALELESPLLVVGLPRGGVPVAAEVARRLRAPLDVVLVRKVGVPGYRELAMGALGEGDVLVRSDDVIAHAQVRPDEFDAAVEVARAELTGQADRFRAGRQRQEVDGRTVVVVDDGIATGATARAACAVLRAAGAAHIVLAVPVAPSGWQHDLAGVADTYVAVDTPARFGAVGAYYTDFSETSDAQVIDALAARG